MIRSIALVLTLAHPLGNFSINEYVGLTVTPHQVSAVAIVDAAEIPTLQDRPAVDTDGNGTVSDAERVAHAGRVCDSVAAAIKGTVDGRALVWTVGPSTFDYAPVGRAGRVTAALRAVRAGVRLHRFGRLGPEHLPVRPGRLAGDDRRRRRSRSGLTGAGHQRRP